MSGFVLTHLLTHQTMTIWGVIAQRFFRLWPLHAAAVILSLVIYYNGKSKGLFYPNFEFFDPRTLAENFLFLMNLGIVEAQVINAPSWSIGIELWASSLLLPLFVRLSWQTNLAIAVAVYAFIGVTAPNALQAAATYRFLLSWGFLEGVAGMALGCAAYKAEPLLSKTLLSKGATPFQVLLGRVDGFDQDEAQSKRDEGAVVLVRFLAA
jgi:peptidoglycan/LPS O-acetylase OafA/YrhL